MFDDNELIKEVAEIFSVKVGFVFSLNTLDIYILIGSIIIKANIEVSGKETEKYPRNVFMIIIVWMVI